MDKDCPRATPAGGDAGRGQAAKQPTPAAGGGKSKGKGKNKSGGKKGSKFDGVCNKCGRWGHRANDYRSVMALEDETQECVNTMAE
eukprot:9698745-Heterocapsa_arctica.AAC.1